ncbi:MAG: ABC transporter permease [Chlorobi bacterium]|nr:ABC transporter permease [Chlorobiota bacterium]
MTLVAILSVVLGTAALIITFTIIDGFERDIRQNLFGFSSHVRVGTFRGSTVPDDASRIKTIENVPGVAGVYPFLEKEAIIVTRDNIDGVMVKGLPQKTDLSLIKARMVSGEYTLERQNGKPSLIMGKRLASRLSLKVGDKVVLFSVGKLEQFASTPKVQFVIRGLYETGMAEYIDDQFVLTDLRTAQKLFSAPGRINGYDVRCVDPGRADAIANALQLKIGYPFDPRSVFSIYRNLFVWIDLQRELIPVVIGTLIFISAFNVIATLLMFVTERTHTVGVLRSLGVSRRSIRRIFLVQGGLIGIAGAVAGAFLAFVLCYAQQEFHFFSLPEGVYYMVTVPIYMRAEVFALVIAGATALSFIASYIPALLASRLDPVTALRFF